MNTPHTAHATEMELIDRARLRAEAVYRRCAPMFAVEPAATQRATTPPASPAPPHRATAGG